MEVAQPKGVALIFVMVLIVTFFGIGIVYGAGQKAIRKFPILEHGTLELNVPTSWKVEVHKPKRRCPPPSSLNQHRGRFSGLGDRSMEQ